jgi:hypothetical protein
MFLSNVYTSLEGEGFMGMHLKTGIVAATMCVTTVAPSPNGRVIQTASMSVARASHTSTRLPDGRVLIAGGFAGSGGEQSPYSSTEIYDPATNRFTAGPSLREGRVGHTATVLSDGRILFAGGWTANRGARGSAELYDPATGTMSATGRMSVTRTGQTATLLSDGRVLMTGGVDESDTRLATSEIYDPKTGRFSATAGMSVSRDSHTATLLPDGRVLIVGGASGRYGRPPEVQRSIEIFDPATNRFAVAGQLTIPRYKHGAIAMTDGRVLIVGGSDNRDWSGQYASAEVFDLARGDSRPVGDMTTPRFKVEGALAVLHNGRVLVGGGAAGAELFDPRANVFLAIPGSVGGPRQFSTATLLADGRVLITGGYARTGSSGPQSSGAAHLFVP